MTAMSLHLLRILIVDDEEANIIILKSILQRAGYTQLTAVRDAQSALKRFDSLRPDLVILDYRMPRMHGLDFMAALGSRRIGAEYLPILMVTADDRPELREQALAGGARDFLAKPLNAVEVLLRVRNLLQARYFYLQLRDQNEQLEDRVRKRTEQLELLQVEMLVRLAKAAEYRDDATGEHVWRVARISALLAGQLGLPSAEVELILRAARLHDVGKIGIPDGILLSPRKLTPAEFQVVQNHTTLGAELLSGSQSRLIQLAETIALTHHEHWDGNGYPQGLAGEEIPLPGRILAVADVYDALTHDRPHRRAFAPVDAMRKIRKLSATQLDPAVVQALEDLFGSHRLPVD
jgi:putative two-component system response regulator